VTAPEPTGITDRTVELWTAGQTRNMQVDRQKESIMTDDNEIYVPSIDVCAWCGDVYCGGIHCIAELDPDDPKDAEAIEVLQAVIRAGKVQIQANAVLARAENRL